MGHRREEVAERFERHVADGAEVLAGAHEPLFDGEVLRPLLDRQRDTDEGDARARAHAVGDGLLEPVAVADPAEVGEQELGHRVVAAFERRGQPEPFLVLLEQRSPQDLAAQAVAFVGDEQAAGLPGRYGLVRGGGVTRRDEHVTGVRDVAAAVAQPPDPRVGKRDPEPAVPLLHEDARRYDDEHEAAAPQRVGGRGNGDVGLARAGDGLDHTSAAAAQPAHERVELPAVELAVGRDRFREQGSETRTGTHGTTTVPVGRSGPGRSRAISPRPTGPGTVNAPRPGGMSAGSRTG